MNKVERQEYEFLLEDYPGKKVFLDFVEKASADMRYYRTSSHVFRILLIIAIVNLGAAICVGIHLIFGLGKVWN